MEIFCWRCQQVVEVCVSDSGLVGLCENNHVIEIRGPSYVSKCFTSGLLKAFFQEAKKAGDNQPGVVRFPKG
jgi:hypothetical protein